ncbi:putative signal peptide peptidase SppA [Siminovitchia terrae]|uniref:Signal peptide peptidase SppA n=1 Tax=Siminovitchia terrae TaxID=1914933 RepID=A0ABQ4L2P8_SIMTE|nr:signal peptide peptidase SppA [Siminovitchia terrae]GIN91841.1 putative signal peptide peptidase SppA [Siminovitchia terrae]GIN98551.1 putative signal peptide peptidase SppA [Siminovitchia terrae]
MNGKRWAALGIAAGVFFFSIIVNMASAFIFEDFSKMFKENMFTDEAFSEEVIDSGNPLKRIAVLEVDGVIQDTGDARSYLSSPGYSHRDFMEQLNQVKEDSSIKGIVLRVNSPGGGTNESAEIRHKIVEIQKETKKPVYVSMGSMAASGGYYISAPADKIFASTETLTGSLGVIMQGVNYSGLTDKIGIDFMTIKSGKYKDIMSGHRKMTAEEVDILESMLTNSYNEFVRIIAEGRDMKEDKVRKIADGRVYDGRQAKELDLIDDFGYTEDVIEAMKKDFKIKDAEVFKYSSTPGLGSLFSMTAQKFSGGSEMGELVNMLSQPNSPRMMYLYAQ